MDPKKFYKNREILITGGMGCLGSNLAIRLVGLGARVTLIDNFLYGHGANEHNIVDIRDRVESIRGDIRDADAMTRAVRGKQTIFHIAGQTSHTDSMVDPFLDIDINCVGNIVFLQAVKKSNPEAHVIYTSTRAVYGAPDAVPATEDIRPNATDIYGVNKHAGEAYHLIYHRAHGVPVTVLRFSNGYGPRAQILAPKFGILNWFVGLILRGETINVFGDGAQLRDYTYVDDFVEAFLLAGMNRDTVGNVYNIGAVDQIRFIDMVKTLIEIAGRGEYKLIPWPPDYKKIEIGDFACDITRARKDLGWSPKTGFRDGLRKTFEFYEKNLKHYLPE